MKKNIFEIVLIIVAALLFRIYLLSLNLYQTVFFDEAVPGLMGLEMLHGKCSIY